jgi:glycosyltransferase involved in cell wall biosynthesis
LLFSIIIPVYNRQQWIGRAIRSVLEQTYGEWELLVVDDASQDDTPALVRREFGAAVRLIELPKNVGVSAARNRGIKEARGEWLAFLDSDDEWLPHKLEKQRAALLASPREICHTDEVWVRNGVRVNPHKHHQKYGGDIFFKALSLCVMSPSSIVIHRRVFEEVGLFDEALPACEDYDLWLRIAARYEVFYQEEKLIIKYGGHEDQLSQAYYAMDRFRVYSLDKLLGAMPELEAEKREAARDMLMRKAKIVHKGAKKRDNKDLVQSMQVYIERWQ